jgi:predicted dehydrogenase
MSQRNARRDFLKQSGLAAVGYWVGNHTLRAEDSKSPNEKVRIACIGVGGKGSSDTDHAGQYGDIVALCDIDDKMMDKKAEKFPAAQKFNDFRKMLEQLGGNIDAVTVSTPDHTHAPAAVMAMKMGKHVYVQKPLTHSVYEARVMRETAAKMNVVTQMGNQGTAENGLRRAVELIQSGVIGAVREVHVWTNRPVWDQAPTVMSRPAETPEVPSHVHWDEFLGPAPLRPYNACYHPFKWRGWWDFGTGAVGDMGCHTANMAFMALKIDAPTSIVAEAGDVNPETCPSWARVTFDVPSRGEMPALKFFWYEGREGGRHNKEGKRMLPPVELLSQVLKEGEKLSDSGSLLVGDKGMLFSPNDYGAKYRLLPESQYEDYKGPEETLPRNGGGDPGMKREWIDAIKGGPKPMSNFDYAGRLTEFILLGNVAIRTGKRIDWDAVNMKAIGCPEADPFIRREYRSGWTL